jgi:hypothetical protein
MNYKNQMLKQIAYGRFSKKKYIDMIRKKNNDSIELINSLGSHIIKKNTYEYIEPVINCDIEQNMDDTSKDYLKNNVNIDKPDIICGQILKRDRKTKQTIKNIKMNKQNKFKKVTKKS